MSGIILCNRTFSAKTFKNECGIDIELASSLTCANPDMILANTPYLLKGGNSAIGATTLAKLSNSAITQNLTNLALSFGGDNLIALSSISAQLQEYNVGLMGASTSVYANRMEGLVGSVKNYQSALMEYRLATKTKSTLKVAAKQKAKIAFDKMQNSFKHEIKVVTSQVKSNRGTPLANFDRGANIARSSRNIAKLDVITPVQANNIVKFTKHAKFLGNGLAVIDFGSRVGNIHNSYKAGGNWEREMFIESSSFAASAMAGTLVVDTGLALLVFATPAGWMGLVVGGLAIAGTAAVASIITNNYIKNNSGDAYDIITKELSRL
ncbi:hypothetical protein [Photobacterium profundum]|uniref:Channel forming colicins domain-containing protein n=1 Tax=Photobacterium profundum (strain SS9) TaxID=298386 RepID=Q6LS95_PHOPR|nr:hypothetical protein [Photobacterium profundum]CAG19831.1 hypothetical protein PBPRA1420 [Photobacterium profundum SS9]